MKKTTKCFILLFFGLIIMPACSSIGRNNSINATKDMKEKNVNIGDTNNDIEGKDIDIIDIDNDVEDEDINIIDINDSEDSDIKSDSLLTEDQTGKKDLKRIGAVNYGYVDIPSDWVKFDDVDVTRPIIQYSDIYGKSIITLDAWEDPEEDPELNAKALWHQIEQEGAQDTSGATVTLGGRQAYQVYGYYADEDIMLIMWVFKTEDNYMHYIAAESSLDNIFDVLALVEESFSLEQ